MKEIRQARIEGEAGAGGGPAQSDTCNGDPKK